MKEIPAEVVNFLNKQHYLTVATIDEKGFPHTSCKGLVKIEGDRLYLLDLYKQRTYRNLKVNKKVNVTAVDGAAFEGYTVKGRAAIVSIKKAHREMIDLWKENIVKRVSHRVLAHLKKETLSSYHPESRMPEPQYIIMVKAAEIVDLVPVPIRGPE